MVHAHRPGGSQVLTAAKAVVLLLGAAILPACGGGDTRDTRDNVSVFFYNVGAEAATVRIEVRSFGAEDTDEFLLMPNDSSGFFYDNVQNLAVSVLRTSDNLLLFVDSWDARELRHAGDMLGITVAP
jgi:hypothetical protein